MQTFLPYESFQKSAQCLDNKRLNKQITEAMQIYTANVNFELGIKSGWQNHPAVKMWRGYNEALLGYRNWCIREWHSRGYSSHTISNIAKVTIYPPWLGSPEFHLSHKSNLLRKDFEHYSKFFGKDIPVGLPYIWPV